MLQVNEDAALLNRHVTLMTPPHFSTAVYSPYFKGNFAAVLFSVLTCQK